MKISLEGTALCNGKTVRYYLLTEYLKNGIETYGVLVEYMWESARISAITMSYRRIKSLLNALKQGCVTPVSLRDIVEDWLLDSACNF